MGSIGIIVGEDADLPKDLIKNLPVAIFPFVVIEGKTSQPSPKILEELFIKNLKIYKDLLIITISSFLSGTYNSATQAKNLINIDDRKRINIIDSKISTGGEGLIVLKIIEELKKNSKLSVDALLKRADKFILSTHLLGVFDDPYFLQRGGRINNVQALVIKNMLRAGFRPILTVKDGKIKTKKIQRERNKAKALFAEFYDSTLEVEPQKISVAITHFDCEEEAYILKNLVQKYNKNIKIEYVSTISPVVGTHLGPGSLILSFIENE